MLIEGQLVAKGFDIIQASIAHPIAIAFPKTRGGAYAPAVNICKQSERYGEADVEGVLMHFATFAASQEDMSRAWAVLSNMKGYRGLMVYAGGKLQDWWKLTRVLMCYRDSMACNDWRAHCYVVPVASDRIFPCRHLNSYGFRLSPMNPANYDDQLQAGAVREGCAWCPNFKAIQEI